MELKNRLGLVQQHYEKVLLGIALLGLILAVVWLNQKKNEEAEKLQSFRVRFERQTPEQIPALDLSQEEKALAAVKTPPPLDFSIPHHLFNPVKWQRRPDGSLLKIATGTEVGPEALQLTKVTPLHFTISLDQTGSLTGFHMSVTSEADPRPQFRVRIASYVGINGKDRGNTFTVKEVKGTPFDPEVTIEFVSNNERVTIKRDKPYVRVDGYKADLTYPFDPKPLIGKRVGDTLTLGGEDYSITSITKNSLVLSAKSNDKPTTIRLKPAA